ncbi:MAG: urea ABC transporter ATP-binding protein UrtD [Chloroflexi bacterium]|nr:urea ABC transporter ATP-binding protein UrtD [Chloroflexota bacterium]
MSKAILAIDDLVVSFDGVRVLDGLSLRVGYGELRFLIGPNGAGKTTLLDVITGRVRPIQGMVLFDGRIDVRRYRSDQLARLGIGRKFQAPSLFPELTVRENLIVAANSSAPLLRLLGRTAPAILERVRRILTLIGLGDRAGVRAGRLSHGEKQWLEIGMVLVQEPKLLLLDEPVAGMTRAEREWTGVLLRQISADRSVLVIEHDMQFVRQFGTTVTVLHAGRVLTEGPMAAVQANEQVIDVYLGRRHHATGAPAARKEEERNACD